MNLPTSSRTIRLIDTRGEARSFVAAEIIHDYPISQIEETESTWKKAREEAANTGLAAGLAPLEHEHWNWRTKADSVQAGIHLLTGVVCEDETQGLMALFRLPRPARIGTGFVVYVDYLETAPWNLKASAITPRFIGVGTALIADAIRISAETGVGGRIGLHSLPQAEPFYARCRMARVGADPDYYDLTYFEHTSQSAGDWLASIGESL